MTSTAGVTTLEQRMGSMEVAFATLSATLGTKLDAVTASLAAMETALSTMHSDHETRVRLLESRPAPDGDIKDHEARLRVLEANAVDPKILDRVSALERFKWMLVGAGMAAGGIVGGITGAIVSALAGG